MPPNHQHQVPHHDQKQYPRISRALTIPQLKAEASVRGHDLKNLPRTKMDLLYFLVDGSIHLRETQAYKDLFIAQVKVKELKRVIESERYDLVCQSLGIGVAKDKNEPEQPNEEEEFFTVYSFPRVHRCGLINANSLKTSSSTRQPRCNKVFCADTCVYSCEQCNFHICRSCFESCNRGQAAVCSTARKKKKKKRPLTDTIQGIPTSASVRRRLCDNDDADSVSSDYILDALQDLVRDVPISIDCVFINKSEQGRNMEKEDPRFVPNYDTDQYQQDPRQKDLTWMKPNSQVKPYFESTHLRPKDGWKQQTKIVSPQGNSRSTGRPLVTSHIAKHSFASTKNKLRFDDGDESLGEGQH
mmetsp:Transcript_2026/g.2759  ORF Transcript_2026/g.2759 Transcript_2026/m.2759 type:complete len:357 (+) Transcript_2026:117-1187(+)